jgi:hypothetical protein
VGLGVDPDRQELDSLYEADGFGGEKTMRARVIRELINEIRALRRRLSELGDSSSVTGYGVHPNPASSCRSSIVLE